MLFNDISHVISSYWQTLSNLHFRLHFVCLYLFQNTASYGKTRELNDLILPKSTMNAFFHIYYEESIEKKINMI